MAYIARISENGRCQELKAHLSGVAKLCSDFAIKLGLDKTGGLLGYLHDLGKYSEAFQKYILSANGISDPDCEESELVKGKIDHSSAGGQILKKLFEKGGICDQILALPLFSHHSGLINVLEPNDNIQTLHNRFKKPIDPITIEKDIEEKIKNISGKAVSQLIHIVEKITKEESQTVKFFYYTMLVKFLFSCLIDADRTDSADFGPMHKHTFIKPDWQGLCAKFEENLQKIQSGKLSAVNEIRKSVSNSCQEKAFLPQGIYTLTVPTGGGKTYASLRYALHHAQKYHLDHIIYIIPYTSIIEQNASEIRKILGNDEAVLEHHSNLESEKMTWRYRLATENWDSPIILTTMVQFLETLFSGGTKSARRIHQLAKSILIFDEIQTLPIKCTHLFCNAINFLVKYGASTAVMCTATQPLLGEVDKTKGALNITGELMDDVSRLFDDLKRVEIINKRKKGGWSCEDTAGFAISEFTERGNCLVITNTKKWAYELYLCCKERVDRGSLFHLSTNMCPAHRKEKLAFIKNRLETGQPVLCFSTQLIEAGVNVDFNAVIRLQAGLDSIAQAAGRCNRNGNYSVSPTYVVNPQNENIHMLKDIKLGSEASERIFSERKDGFLSKEVMDRYFQYYFFAQKDKEYIINNNLSILDLLSDNKKQTLRVNGLRQSFKEAGKYFKAIDSATIPVVVPYKDGERIIAELCGLHPAFETKYLRTLLREAQRYSVNLFEQQFNNLHKLGAVHETQKGSGIYYLDKSAYDESGIQYSKAGYDEYLE